MISAFDNSKSEIGAGKSKLRNEFVSRRQRMDPDTAAEKSLSMAVNFDRHFAGRAEIRTIMGYYPVQNEPSPLPILRACLEAGRRVALPCVDREAQTVQPVQVENLDELSPGAFGIPEPAATLPKVSLGDIDLCVVPGVAFDRHGRRLGRGGGFYDRFLARLRPDCLKVALAFDWQIVDTVLIEAWDVPVDCIVSETEVHFV